MSIASNSWFWRDMATGELYAWPPYKGRPTPDCIKIRCVDFIMYSQMQNS